MKSLLIKKITKFDCYVIALVTVLTFITLYPFLYILALSLSNMEAVFAGKVKLFPVGFNLDAFVYVFKDPVIYRAYFNTITYSLTGTLIGLAVSSLTAYPLAFEYKRKSFIMKLMVFTIYFNGGMIPAYLLVQNLKLLDTMWAIVLPGALNVWNVIIFRTFFAEMPASIRESAFMDGANDFNIYYRFYIPLSKPVFAALGLFSAVAYWNNFFGPLLYITSAKKYPLSIILRQLLVQNQYQFNELMRTGSVLNTQSIKAATIIVTILPVIIIYPFLQKYFVKGVMIGAVKG